MITVKKEVTKCSSCYQVELENHPNKLTCILLEKEDEIPKNLKRPDLSTFSYKYYN